jgi:hypothetical protein
VRWRAERVDAFDGIAGKRTGSIRALLPPALIFGEEGDDACQFIIELLKNG